MLCRKYNLSVTQCSRRSNSLTKEVCDECLLEEPGNEQEQPEWQEEESTQKVATTPLPHKNPLTGMHDRTGSYMIVHDRAGKMGLQPKFKIQNTQEVQQ
jgi:hypothetical protein